MRLVRYIALVLVILFLTACDVTPLTSPLPTPEPQFHVMAPAYPGPAQGTEDEDDNVPTVLVHRYYFPQIFDQREPSILGWEAASDGQALAARAAILALPPGTVRTGIPWAEIEPVQGEGYTWSASKNAHINLLAEGGNRIIGILLWPPQWALTSPGCSPVDPAYYADWLNYVRAVVERYGDRVDVWEVWNEPDMYSTPNIQGWGCWGDIWAWDFGGTEYGRLVAMTADAVREVQPGATVISGGLLLGCDVAGEEGACTGMGLAFLRSALPEMEQHIDGVGFHSYAFWDLSTPTDTALLDAKVKALRRLTTLPLWNTEGGWLCHRTVDPVLCASQAYEDAQAEYVGLWADSCRWLGLESCVWYSISYNGWQHADLMGPGGVKRAGYWTLAAELRR